MPVKTAELSNFQPLIRAALTQSQPMAGGQHSGETPELRPQKIAITAKPTRSQPIVFFLIQLPPPPVRSRKELPQQG